MIKIAYNASDPHYAFIGREGCDFNIAEITTAFTAKVCASEVPRAVVRVDIDLVGAQLDFTIDGLVINNMVIPKELEESMRDYFLREKGVKK